MAQVDARESSERLSTRWCVKFTGCDGHVDGWVSLGAPITGPLSSASAPAQLPRQFQERSNRARADQLTDRARRGPGISDSSR
jgi:hypothetical protein